MPSEAAISELTTLLVFGAAVIVTALATAWVRMFANRRGLLDAVTSSRKIHSGAVPRLGGIAMAIGLVVAIGCALLVDDALQTAISDQWMPSLAITGALLAIIAVGVLDDLQGVRARNKLLVQLLAATAVVAGGQGIQLAELVPGIVVDLGYFGPMLTLFWIVGVINALNLIDGMDGLAGGVALIAALGLSVLALVNGDVVGALIPVALTGVVSGFLIYNWHPASIFMGDTGSMMLGLLLAVSALALRGTGGAEAPIPVLIPVLLLAVPLLDTTLAVIRRLLAGRSPFSADKEHLHHRILLHLGVGQRGTVLLLLSLAASLSVVGVGLSRASQGQTLVLVAVAACAVLAVLWRLGYLDVIKLQGALRKRNATLRAVLRQAGREMVKATDVNQLWAAVEPLSEVLGVTRLELHLDTPAPREELGFQRLSCGGDADPLLVQVLVRTSSGLRGKLIGIWRDGRVEVDRDHELAMELTAERLAIALDALGKAQLPERSGLLAAFRRPPFSRTRAEGRGR